jgi:hypothetical protein
MLRSQRGFLQPQSLTQQSLGAGVVAARLGLLSSGHYLSYVTRGLHHFRVPL